MTDTKHRGGGGGSCSTGPVLQVVYAYNYKSGVISDGLSIDQVVQVYIYIYKTLVPVVLVSHFTLIHEHFAMLDVTLTVVLQFVTSVRVTVTRWQCWLSLLSRVAGQALPQTSEWHLHTSVAAASVRCT